MAFRRSADRRPPGGGARRGRGKDDMGSFLVNVLEPGIDQYCASVEQHLGPERFKALVDQYCASVGQSPFNARCRAIEEFCVEHFIHTNAISIPQPPPPPARVNGVQPAQKTQHEGGPAGIPPPPGSPGPPPPASGSPVPPSEEISNRFKDDPPDPLRLCGPAWPPADTHGQSSPAAKLKELLLQTALEVCSAGYKTPRRPRLLHLLLLGALCLQPVETDETGSHSYRSLYSALSPASVGRLPRFSVVTYVDDVLVERYTSDSHRMEPRAPWMEKINSEEPEYWERETEILEVNGNAQRANVKIMMTRLNQTGGLHSLQRVYGCELRADGSIGGFDQYAYDGHDLISFDQDTVTFTAAMDPARGSADRWNSDWLGNRNLRHYLEGGCIEYLKKYLEYGEESLQKRVRPEFRVSRRMTGSGTTLTCYAYGFYPREIEVKWVRNGEEMPWRSKQILPHPDGTYQAKTTVELHEGDDVRNYACQVEHSSLEEAVTVVCDKSLPTWITGPIVGSIALVLLLGALVIGGFFFWKKKQSGRPAAAVNTASQGCRFSKIIGDV